MPYAPIILFVYNRPHHTRLTIEALRQNAECSKSVLFVFCDAPKSIEAMNAVEEVRAYLRTVKGFQSVSIIERDRNFGLARSIVSGVSQVIEQYGEAIVLEDDLVTSPFFLKYMNDGLNQYRNTSQVASVHGYVYPVRGSLPETFFLRGADCWGWGTWARAWKHYNPDGKYLLEQLSERQLTHRFDFDGAMAFTGMLRDQTMGKIDSWAIRWHASTFLDEMLTLYPSRSLVTNIGLDGTGRHCPTNNSFDVRVSAKPVKVQPIPVQECHQSRSKVKRYFRDTHVRKMNAWHRLFDWIGRWRAK